MVRCVFTDFDEFADAIKGLDGRYIPTARSMQQWWIDPVRIGNLTLQQVQIGGASTFAGTGRANELSIGMPITDPTAISIDGEVLTPESLIIIRHNRALTSSAQTTSRWAGMALPLPSASDSYFNDAEELDAVMRGGTHLRANPASLRRVGLLVALLCSGDQSISIVDAASLAAAQEEMFITVSELFRTCTTVNESQRLGRPPVDRDKIIARCFEFVRENGGQPILVSDLCRIAQVSERTLRNIFYEYFGVGPVRFLKVRQLQEVRSALLDAGASGGKSVSSIATRFGVWDFSLFARNYRALYGETPSQTLRGARPRNGLTPNRTSLGALQSWMNYASRRFEQAAAENRATLR